MTSHGIPHRSGAQGLPPSCSTSRTHQPKPSLPSPFPPSYQRSAHSAPGQAQSAQGEIWGLSPGFAGSVPDRPTLAWAVGSQQPPRLSIWGRDAGLAGQPCSLSPLSQAFPPALSLEPAAFLASQVLEHQGRGMGNLTSSGISALSRRPTSQGMGEQKNMAFVCILLLKNPFCNHPSGGSR